MDIIDVTKVAHFSGHKGSIFSLLKGFRKNTIFSGADDGYIVEWDYALKGDGKLIVQVNRPVYSMLLATGLQQLYCGTAGGNLHVTDLVAGKEIRNIEAHKGGIFDMRETGDHIITAGGDGNLCIWSKEGLQLQKTIYASMKSARTISIHPLKNEFAVGFSDYYIRVYSSADFELLHEIEAHSNSVFALSYSPDGNRLYSGGRDVKLRNWDIDHGYGMLLDIPAHTLHINAIAFSPDGQLYATASMDKTLKIWNADTNTLLKVIDRQKNDGHKASVNKLLWLNNRELVTCSDDRTIMMWRLEVN